MIKDSKFIAKKFCFLHCMSCHNYYSLFFHLLNQVPNLPSADWIHARSRLIHENDFWFTYGTQSYRHSSSHSTRVFPNSQISTIKQAYFSESLIEELGDIRISHSFYLREQEHVIKCSQFIP